MVTFHVCEDFDYRAADDVDYEKVVEPVMRRHDPFGTGLDPAISGLHRAATHRLM